MPLYDGVSGVARKVVKKYDGVSGVARKVTKAYTGVSGVARQYFSSEVPIGNLEVGSSVFTNVKGVRTEFMVVNQGTPDSYYTYEGRGGDTWLLMKDVHILSQYDNREGYPRYPGSVLDSYLNHTFFYLFDKGFQDIVREVKLPFSSIEEENGEIMYFSGIFSTKVFVLSYSELINGNTENDAVPFDGTTLDYFRVNRNWDYYIAYYSGTPSEWWTRSPSNYHTDLYDDRDKVRIINKSGMSSFTRLPADVTIGVRPALVIPDFTIVDSNLDIIT